MTMPDASSTKFNGAVQKPDGVIVGSLPADSSDLKIGLVLNVSAAVAVMDAFAAVAELLEPIANHSSASSEALNMSPEVKEEAVARFELFKQLHEGLAAQVQEVIAEKVQSQSDKTD